MSNAYTTGTTATASLFPPLNPSSVDALSGGTGISTPQRSLLEGRATPTGGQAYYPAFFSASNSSAQQPPPPQQQQSGTQVYNPSRLATQTSSVVGQGSATVNRANRPSITLLNQPPEAAAAATRNVSQATSPGTTTSNTGENDVTAELTPPLRAGTQSQPEPATPSTTTTSTHTYQPQPAVLFVAPGAQSACIIPAADARTTYAMLPANPAIGCGTNALRGTAAIPNAQPPAAPPSTTKAFWRTPAGVMLAIALVAIVGLVILFLVRTMLSVSNTTLTSTNGPAGYQNAGNSMGRASCRANQSSRMQRNLQAGDGGRWVLVAPAEVNNVAANQVQPDFGKGSVNEHCQAGAQTEKETCRTLGSVISPVLSTNDSGARSASPRSSVTPPSGQPVNIYVNNGTNTNPPQPTQEGTTTFSSYSDTIVPDGLWPTYQSTRTTLQHANLPSAFVSLQQPSQPQAYGATYYQPQQSINPEPQQGRWLPPEVPCHNLPSLVQAF